MPWWLSACQQKNLDKRCMQHNGGRGRSGVVSEGQAEAHGSSLHHLIILTSSSGFMAFLHLPHTRT
jgi:hypothetical protein